MSPTGEPYVLPPCFGTSCVVLPQIRPHQQLVTTQINLHCIVQAMEQRSSKGN